MATIADYDVAPQHTLTFSQALARAEILAIQALPAEMRERISCGVALVREGKVRALAVTTGKRSSELPDVNTVQDAGFPGFEATAWYALAAPAGTPSEIIDKLNAAANAFLKSPKGQETLANLSMQAVGGTPADLKAFIASELQKWGPVVKEANIAM